MPFTWEDFDHWYFMDHFPKLTPEEQREALERLSPERRRAVLESLPPEERLSGLTVDEIRRHLDRMTEGPHAEQQKPRRGRLPKRR